ncbi:MAG TPA: DUF1566 domain-containing protein [Candidatus Limnocylindrales bacterium]|nr:DUF1566 domain-containing protein [Candidatus Limnocylindrales bacterium]
MRDSRLLPLLVSGAIVALLLPRPDARADTDPAISCQVKKLDASRAYGACRLKTVSKSVKKGTATDFTKCDTSFDRKWTAIELIGGSNCPTFGDGDTIQEEIVDDTSTIASLLATGTLPTCGDGELNGRETCDGAELGGVTCADFGYLGGTISCRPSCLLYDLSECTGRSVYPATGQTVSYQTDTFGMPDQPVPDDGALQTGGALAFVDNGDGTITDTNTGLMWEKKGFEISGDHSADTTYAWSSLDSGTIWDWIERVNNENGGAGYAGHNDWRIPNRRELDSLIDFSRSDPSVHPAFDSACVSDCVPTSCSCTVADEYWSSTTSIANDSLAWAVSFSRGKAEDFSKTSRRAVRAVRGPD